MVFRDLINVRQHQFPVAPDYLFMGLSVLYKQSELDQTGGIFVYFFINFLICVVVF